MGDWDAPLAALTAAGVRCLCVRVRSCVGLVYAACCSNPKLPQVVAFAEQFVVGGQGERAEVLGLEPKQLRRPLLRCAQLVPRPVEPSRHRATVRPTQERMDARISAADGAAYGS